MLNLDTHIVVFALEESLYDREDALIRSDNWAISDIVIWEIAMLRSRNRITLDTDSELYHDFLRACTIFPISAAIAKASMNLDFRTDPADHIIAATSIVHALPLLTRDKTIRKSKLVEFAYL